MGELPALHKNRSEPWLWSGVSNAGLGEPSQPCLLLAGTQAAVLARSTTTPDPNSLLDQSGSGLSLMVYLKKIWDKGSSTLLKVREIHAMEKSVRTFGDPFVLETAGENTAKISRLTMCSSECWALSVCYLPPSAKPPSPRPLQIRNTTAKGFYPMPRSVYYMHLHKWWFHIYIYEKYFPTI